MFKILKSMFLYVLGFLFGTKVEKVSLNHQAPYQIRLSNRQLKFHTYAEKVHKIHYGTKQIICKTKAGVKRLTSLVYDLLTYNKWHKTATPVTNATERNLNPLATRANTSLALAG